MNAIFSWILDSISIIVGFTGIPSDLLDGFLNDAFFAFQLIENFERRQGQGPYGRREKFIPTGAAPYTVDALFSFITAAWDTRGYRSALAVFQNGSPVSVGREVQFGGLMSIIAEGETGEMEMFTDYIENITISKDRMKAVKVMVQIGDGKAEEAPIVKTQRLLTGIQESLNVVTLSPTS